MEVCSVQSNMERLHWLRVMTSLTSPAQSLPCPVTNSEIDTDRNMTDCWWCCCCSSSTGSEPSDLSGCIPRSFAVTLQRWVEFVRHEDRREDHSMSGVLREGEQTIARAAPSTVAVGFVSGPNSADGRQSSRRTNGLEMKCFNEDGLNVDRRCTKRHPNQRRGAN